MLTDLDTPQVAINHLSKEFDAPCHLYFGVSRQVTTSLGKYIFKVGTSRDLEARTRSMNGKTFEQISLLGATDWELRRVQVMPDCSTAKDVERSVFAEFDKFKDYFINMRASPALQGSGKTEIYRINPESLARFIKSHYASSNRAFKNVFREFRRGFDLLSPPRPPEHRKDVRMFRDL